MKINTVSTNNKFKEKLILIIQQIHISYMCCGEGVKEAQLVPPTPFDTPHGTRP